MAQQATKSPRTKHLHHAIIFSWIMCKSNKTQLLGCKFRQNSGQNSGSGGNSSNFQWNNLKTGTITIFCHLLAIAKHE